MTDKLPGEPYTRISCEEAHKFYGHEDSHFIDVRNNDEYESGHIPGSIHIPVDQFIQSIDKLPEKGNLYLVCLSKSITSKYVLLVTGMISYFFFNNVLIKLFNI